MVLGDAALDPRFATFDEGISVDLVGSVVLADVLLVVDTAAVDFALLVVDFVGVGVAVGFRDFLGVVFFVRREEDRDGLGDGESEGGVDVDMEQALTTGKQHDASVTDRFGHYNSRLEMPHAIVATLALLFALFAIGQI
ncbi:MAG: hypothetical protein F6K09_07705 [Merismopedia sp. SIO2A8]|nr:hypothetical protein [Merismopedia sp. SIO2A8]